MCIDVSLKLAASQPIAADHGYQSCSVQPQVCPEIHQQNAWGISPISGTKKMLDAESAIDRYGVISLCLTYSCVTDMVEITCQAFRDR